MSASDRPDKHTRNKASIIYIYYSISGMGELRIVFGYLTDVFHRRMLDLVPQKPTYDSRIFYILATLT